MLESGANDRQKPALRHGFWLVWNYHWEWRWHPAVTDDYGNLAMINSTRAHYSLLSDQGLV